MVNFPTKYFAIDAAPGMIKREPGQAAITATAYVGTQIDMQAANAMDFITVINIEDIAAAGGDRVYTFSVVASNETNRSDATLLTQLTIGTAADIAVETVNAAAGQQLVMRARSEKNGKFYRYVDLHLTAAGTTPSITFSAYVSKEIA